jgi:hypothetical protein
MRVITLPFVLMMTNRYVDQLQESRATKLWKTGQTSSRSDGEEIIKKEATMNQQNAMTTLPNQPHSAQMVPATCQAGLTILPDPMGTTPVNAKEPDSFHPMFPISFAMLPNLFNKPAIETSIYLPNGLQLTRDRIRAAFIGQWGYHHAMYESQQKVAKQELQRLEDESLRLAELLKEKPATRLVDGPTVPHGVARFGWCCLVLSLAILNILAITNCASYFRYQVQGWFLAFLMAAPLLFVSIPLHYVTAKLPSFARKCLGWFLACVGVGAFAVFVFTLATKANPPDAMAILNGTARSDSGMIMWQLSSQIILEVIIAAALWHWLLDMMIINSKMIVNPDVELLKMQLSSLSKAMEPLRDQVAKAQGNLDEMAASLAHWLQLAETIFLAHQAYERRFVERIQSLNTCPNF